MSDINFDCPKCGQNLDAPPDLAGLFIECPSCNAIIKVPASPGSVSPEAAAAAARRNELRPAPPKPPEEKGATMRIEVPTEFKLPPTPQRKIIIKRGEH